MEYLTNITSESALKTDYKKLARDNHPDNGGNTSRMQEINREYEYWRKILNNKSLPLSEVKRGDIVFVNGVESEVILVFMKTFKAKSKETGREAFFDKKSGVCLNNKRFKASF
ncbi:MAG: hypothetical protein J7K53_13570 [Bacteroidales bacterium]|nr:hypothetical protein [Bacteroidales bacterium]